MVLATAVEVERNGCPQMQSHTAPTGPILLRATGLMLHFLLRIRGRRWMIAVVSGRATSQKSESCEEYRCHDFRNCPVCHLLAYDYFILILQSKIGRNRGSKIVLIDGSRLTELMTEFEVAVVSEGKVSWEWQLEVSCNASSFVASEPVNPIGNALIPLRYIGPCLSLKAFHRGS
jgi:hypothetical protein